jgi:protein-disulfide isomerase
MVSNQNIKSVVYYAKSEGIKIDFNSFLYQAENHPNYPTILAITDTLNSYNIENGVIQVSVSEIDLLPDRFAVFLSNEKSDSELYFVEKKDNIYFYTINKKAVEISKTELESRWSNLVLLIEESQIENLANTTENKGFTVLCFFCLGLLVLILIQFQESVKIKLFFIFPILGIIFSVVALQDIFNTKNVFFNSLCNITGTNDCASVIGSTKWKIFELIKLSDLSIVFFVSQFFAFLTFLFIGDTVGFFSIQKVLIFGATPVLFLSLYYQKFVEKKWCTICLFIITVILLEICYLISFQNNILTISIQSFIIFCFVFISIVLIWSVLQKLLTKQKELKEFEIKGNRFMRNYDIFKNTLLASSKIDYKGIVSGNIILGNHDASLKIIIISSPFCKHCADVHTVIDEILKRYNDKVCFDIRFNFNYEQNDEKSKRIHQKLVNIYYNKGQEVFIKELYNWYKNKDEDRLSSIDISQLGNLNVYEILDEQFNWNQKNGISFTPTIIINNYFFPKEYDRKELIHFINDLAEDEDFYINTNN